MSQKNRRIQKNKICIVATLSITIKSFFIPQLKYLSKKGFEVSVICSPDKDLQKLLGDDIKYIPVDIPRGISFFGMLQSTYKLFRIFKKNKFDFVQYSTPNAAFCSSIAAFLARVKIRNYHLMGFRYLGAEEPYRMILKQVEKVTCFISTSIECVSHSNLKLGIAEKIFSQSKATVVWNGSTGGVDLRKFCFENREKWREEIRTKLGYLSDDYVFGFVGRITRDKGVNEILEAYCKVSDTAKLLLVGSEEGIETLDIGMLIEAKTNANIIFLDSVDDIERYYAAIDVLLLPSYREGFGNVIIEAAAMGTPSIVSNIPGPVDAVKEDVTGVLIPKGDSMALAKAMEDCVKRRICFEPCDCNHFAQSHFSSDVLCQQIYQRKMKLMREAE